MDKLLRKFTKSSQIHSEDELGIATQFKEYAATLKMDYVSGESFAPPKTYYTNLEVNKMFNMFDQLGCCLEVLAELRSNMNNDVSSILLSKIHESMEEGDTCKNLKEYYREAVVEHNVDETRYNTLKQKSNDLVKVKNAEKDAEEKKKVAAQVHENIMKEMQYQEELRDYQYLNAIRQFISVYRTYFIAGSQALDELASHLITGKSRTAMRNYDVNDITNYKDNVASQQQVYQQPKPKKPKENKQVFGVALTALMKRERELNRDVVPNMCIDLFDYVEKNGLTMEGIFRLAGEVVGMSYVKKMYDNGKKHLDLQAMITNKEFKDIHVVAGLLKMFLRELPEPLLTYERYDSFLSLIHRQDESQIGYGMLELVKQLPIEHIALLDKLMVFLGKVAAHSSENKMTVSNLSIVFGVNILKSMDNNPMRMAKDSQAINKTCELMIGLYPTYIGPYVRDQIDQFRQQRIQKFNSSSGGEEAEVPSFVAEPYNSFEEESKKKGFLPPPSRSLPTYAPQQSNVNTFTQPTTPTTTTSPNVPKSNIPLPKRPEKPPPSLPTKRQSVSTPLQPTPVSTTPTSLHKPSRTSGTFSNVNLDEDPFTQFEKEQKAKSNLYPSVNNNKWDDPNDFF
ncbi:rho GTPase activating protein [Naegleria gruberi]|uniref:Rho GTPase activating protein n=1 Tax=Naegleria gruberi TaxID=5762 RepID=D2V7H2_NAEGR|nr:rho GTPase activating protein [Naegleria gruberi]EFC47378.1 rho GTPase activating protein [Naegleria gruberi]|eukprot:XP_002680122.1 rho GTPase activating protein [Naegleria gruberi strain NEG-M]